MGKWLFLSNMVRFINTISKQCEVELSNIGEPRSGVVQAAAGRLRGRRCQWAKSRHHFIPFCLPFSSTSRSHSTHLKEILEQTDVKASSTSEACSRPGCNFAGTTIPRFFCYLSGAADHSDTTGYVMQHHHHHYLPSFSISKQHRSDHLIWSSPSQQDSGGSIDTQSKILLTPQNVKKPDMAPQTSPTPQRYQRSAQPHHDHPPSNNSMPS